jgi:hypothetical protein
MNGMNGMNGGHGIHGIHGTHGSATAGWPVVGWLLVSLCVLTGAACLLRARTLPPGARAAPAGEAWMGFAMAAMALPSPAGAPLRQALPAALAAVAVLWELALLAGLLTRRTGRCGWRAGAHRLHHLLGAAVMAYMAWSTTASAGTSADTSAVSGAGTAGQAAAGMLTAYFAVYALLVGVRLLPSSASAPAYAPTLHRPAGAPTPEPAAEPAVEPAADPPGLAAACRVAMATGMAAMLLTM